MPRHTTHEIREAVLNLSEQGKTSREIAASLKIGKSTVNRLIEKFSTTQSLLDLPRSGRPRKTTIRVDKIIKRKSTIDVKKTASEIANELRDENLANVSRSTVARRLNDMGLFGRVAVKKPLISKKNQKARLDFAKKYQHWTPEQWAKVLFSDESKFNLFGSDGKKYVRRPKNTRYDSRYQIPTVKHGGGSVMVWGAMSSQGVGPLHKIEGIMDKVMYRDIMAEKMLPYSRRKMPKNWIFQQDNDPKHKSKLVQGFLKGRKVKLLDHPAQSPDLNPIENLWDTLGRHVGTKKHSNKDDLWRTLQEEWEKIPKDYVKRLVDSMPRRCAAVIAAKSMATKY